MGIRTPDLLNAIEALYQLSYDPERSATDSEFSRRRFEVEKIGGIADTGNINPKKWPFYNSYIDTFRFNGHSFRPNCYKILKK